MSKQAVDQQELATASKKLVQSKKTIAQTVQVVKASEARLESNVDRRRKRSKNIPKEECNLW